MSMSQKEYEAMELIALDVFEEREAQEAQGFDAEHDDGHGVGHILWQLRGRVGETEFIMGEPAMIYPTRKQMIEAAALLFAAIRTHDRAEKVADAIEEAQELNRAEGS